MPPTRTGLARRAMLKADEVRDRFDISPHSALNVFGFLSQQSMHIPQFGGDVDLLDAGRQAVATADAGRTVPRQGSVFAPRPVEIEIIPAIPLVPEDVSDRDV